MWRRGDLLSIMEGANVRRFVNYQPHQGYGEATLEYTGGVDRQYGTTILRDFNPYLGDEYD